MKQTKIHITADIQYVRTRLGLKMNPIPAAFNIFGIGLFASVSMVAGFLFLFG